MPKVASAFRTIGEVSLLLDVPQHVLRFWETRFPQIAPLKSGGGRRYYRPEDTALLSAIRKLLYVDGYTIKGVQRLLKSEGARAIRAGMLPGLDESAASPELQAVGSGIQATSDELLPSKGSGQSLPPERLSKLRLLASELGECARLLAVARHLAIGDSS